MNYIHVTLHKALNDAVSDGLVPKNVASAVKSPRPEKPEIHPLTREQARNCLEAASKEDDRFEALYVVALHCGLREGELLGLKWEDVDLDAGTLAGETHALGDAHGPQVRAAQERQGALRKALSGGRRSSQEPQCAPERGEAEGRFSVAGS